MPHSSQRPQAATDERLPIATAVAALVAIALAAGLEGGYERRLGAVALVAAGAAVVLALWSGALPRLSKGAMVAFGVLGAVLVAQLLPIPRGLRAILAPGLSERLDRVAGTPTVDRDQWLTELTRLDLDVLLGNPAAWTTDLLAGARDEGWHATALSVHDYAWQVGQWAIYVALLLVGWRVARSRPALLILLVGMLFFGLGEGLFGLANRNGPSTGLSPKVYYLGSATGTFINRGHFGAFLAFAVGSAWALAGSLFPLLPEEVRRHMNRKRRSSQPPGVLEASGDKVPRLALLAFAVGLVLVCLVASTSRGPVLSMLVAGALVGGWTRFRRGDGVHLGLGLGVPAVGLVVAVVTAGPFGALARFMALGRNDASLVGRSQLWEASVGAFRDSPLVGSGVGAWSLAIAPHEIVPQLYAPGHAHSEPIELAVELGLVGIAAVVGIIGVGGAAVLRRLDAAEHDLHSSAAVGAGVACLAVALQSIGDFPLRTPGVAIPFAIFVGVVLGGLGVGGEGGRRWPALGLLAVGLSATVGEGLADLARSGTREERLNEAAPVLLLARPNSDEESLQLMDEACAAAAAVPFDAWGQVACATAASRVSGRKESAMAGFVGDMAAARALELHPDDPRMLVQLANAWLRMREATGLPYALGERATVALARAVAMDGWRAEEAFQLARAVSPASVDRIGAAASDEPVSRSRTLYQYGIVLEEEGRRQDARRVEEESANADPQYGPPAFRAGLLAKLAGDAVASEGWMRRFLASRDRPVAMEGWALYHLGESSAAEVRFRRAVAVAPKNRWAWEGLASVARQKEDERAETDAWTRVLAITPGHPLAVDRLRELGRIE